MRQLQRLRVQPQALHAHPIGDVAVEWPFSVGGIAQNGMRQMLAMPPQLVTAPGLGNQRDQGAPRLAESAVGDGQGVRR